MTRGIDDVGKRLVEALEWRKMSLRALHLALKKNEVAGASYPNMVQIRHGKTEPSLGFLAAAASELRVPIAWLAFGLGSMDEPAAIVEGAAERFPPERQARLGIRIEKLLASMPVARKTAAVVDAFVNAFSPNVDPDVWHFVARPWLVLARRAGGGEKAQVGAARTLARALRAPLDRIGVAPADLTPWQLGQYTTLVAAAIDVALAEPHMLKPSPSRQDAKKA